jgi:hypothetical protein
MWKQGGFFATQQQPPAAAYFRICIYVAAAGQSCDSPAFHWMHAAGATVLNRTPVYSALRGQQVTATYRYSFDVPADLELDLSYGWNVGACKSSAPGSCAYPPHPALLRFSTRNLTVTDIEEVIRSDYIAMATEVTNTGITDAGPFRVKSEIVQAEYDEESGKCATRIADSKTPYRAYTANGEARNVLPTDDIPVVGIPLPVVSAVTVDQPQGLSAGSAAQRAPLEFYLTGTPLPAAFLFVTQVDSVPDVVEYDEADNNRAECHVVYP